MNEFLRVYVKYLFANLKNNEDFKTLISVDLNKEYNCSPLTTSKGFTHCINVF